MLQNADKQIPRNIALKLIWDQGKASGLDKAKLRILERYVRAIPSDERGYIRLDKALGLIDNLKRAIKHQDAAFLEMRRGFKVNRVPDVIEVAESKEFANKRDILWPAVKENLWWMHHGTPGTLPSYASRAKPYQENDPPCVIVLSGAAGTGKTQTGWLSGFYTLTLISMLWNPHLELDHDPGSWMLLVIQATKKEISEESAFDRLQYAIDQSPWFQQHFPRRKDYNQELEWPAQRIKVSPLTGEFDAGLSKDILWAMMTEANFMKRYERSKKLAHTDKTEFHVAKEMFDVLADRMETRFSQRTGGFSGKLIVDSQRHHTGDFTDELKARAKTDSQMLVVERTLYEAQAHRYPADEPRFLVELGDDQRPARIIATREQALDPENIREVPERHRKRYEADIEKACQQFLGVPTTATGRFIPFPEQITNAQMKYVELYGESRPFKFQEISFRELFGEIKPGEPVEWERLLNYAYFKQILDVNAPFTMHADMSRTGDATGFGFGRIIGTKVVPSAYVYDKDTHSVVELENVETPIYQIDGLLRIIALSGEIIDPMFVQGLGLELKRLIPATYWYGSADWFEASQLILAWRRAGIIADWYSLDKRPDGYLAYKHALREERLIMMPHPTNDRETRRLQRSAKHAKITIDHPEGECFTKDTRVALLDGTNPTFYELSRRFPNGEKFPVYSISSSGITIGYASKPRCTKSSSPLFEVTLDNYNVVRCTPGHLFLTINFEWVRAENLCPGISLMPLYRAKALRGGWQDYERFWDPILRERFSTHRIIAELVFGKLPDNAIIHHIDGNKTNNDPDNLEITTRQSHSRLHTTERHLSDPDYVKRLRAGHDYYRNHGGNERSRQNMLRLYDEGIFERGRTRCSIEGCEALSNAKGMCDKHYQAMRRREAKDTKMAAGRNSGNHKVIAVNRLDYEEDVWDIEVQDLHNFALSAGIFVHNSKDLADTCAGIIGVLELAEGLKLYRQIEGGAQQDTERATKEDDQEEFGSGEVEEYGTPRNHVRFRSGGRLRVY